MKHLKTLLMTTAATAMMTGTALADGHAKRGMDGEVKIIYWQAPSILNPYLSGGTKDVESASMIVEPLARLVQEARLDSRIIMEDVASRAPLRCVT